MKVNKKKAAQMVGVGRNTLYRHIVEKGISVDEDGLIDVSELIRVYGDSVVKTEQQLEQSQKSKNEHSGTQHNTLLEDKIKQLNEIIENSRIERVRERDQLSDQIEHLKNSLEKSMSQNERLTLLLSDQRSEAEKLKENKKTDSEQKIEELLVSVRQLTEKSSWWPFGKKKSA